MHPTGRCCWAHTQCGTIGPERLSLCASCTEPTTALLPCNRAVPPGALFALVPDEEQVFGNTLHQVHSGPGCAVTLGFLPTGLPWSDRDGGDQRALEDDAAMRAARSAESVATLYYNLHERDCAGWAAVRHLGLKLNIPS